MPDYPYQQHTAAFRALTDVFHAFELPYFLIGGQARDLLLSRMQIPTYAKTKDIDFAVMVRDMGQFEQLRARLLASGFEPTKVAQYRLVWTESHTVIDLLPFGALADAGIVHFPPPGFDLSVRGFQEILPALEYAEIDAERTIRIPIAPLHGIFLLKVIAWAERPEQRMKDLDDMERILYHYWDFCEREALHTDLHLDVFELTGEGDLTKVWSARILGRHIAQLLVQSPLLRAEVAEVLEAQATSTNPVGPMRLKFSQDNQDGEPDLMAGSYLLEQIVAGIRDAQAQ